MKKFFISLLMGCLFIAMPFAAQARCCGKIMGKKIETYGNLSCAKAKSVYKAFNAGHTPKGWTCGQSVGGCGIGQGKNAKGFTFKHQK